MTSTTFFSKMAAPIEWNELPDIALVYIYYNLSDEDRLNTALTCKHWSRIFTSAILWRHRRVVFNAQNAESTAEKELKFLDNLGHCLYRLTLNFGRPTFKTCMPISKAVDSYLQRISKRNDIHIRELELEPLHMEQHWHFILSRNRLITAICRMVRKQKFLESIYMAGARMRLVDGCRLLEALTKGATSRTITTLYMEDFFEINIFPARHPRYVKAMSRFTSLQYIHINYRYLNGEVIRNLTNKLSRTLKNMSIIIDGDVRGMEIRADVWSDFTERCPKAEVGVYLCTTIFRGHDLRTPFVRFMPVSNVYLTSWSRVDETEERLAVLLRHFGNLFGNTLDTFAMFFEHHEPIDAELMYMLRRCRHIKDLCIQARLSADTIVDIMKLQQQNKLALKSVNLTIPDLTEDDWERINAERIRLLTNVTDFVYIGPNEFGSSVGGSTLSANDDEEDGAEVNGIGNEAVGEADDIADDVFDGERMGRARVDVMEIRPDLIIQGNNVEIREDVREDDGEELNDVYEPPRDLNNNDDDDLIM